MFEPGFLPLINDYSFRPPPPLDNDKVCHASVPTRENFPLHHWPYSPTYLFNHYYLSQARQTQQNSRGGVAGVAKI